MSDTLHICGLKVERGQKLRTYLPVLDTKTEIPVTIINGQNDGPTLLITAGIPGGEYPGIAAAMELGRDISPEDIRGCLILMHPVNIQSFWARRAFVIPETAEISTGNSPAMSTVHFHKNSLSAQPIFLPFS